MGGLSILLSKLFRGATNKIDDIAYDQDQKRRKEQLGEFVDLGLSVKWSKNNLEFKCSPQYYGMWQGSMGTFKTQGFCLEKYFSYDQKKGELEKYNTSPQYGPVDGLTQLMPRDDHAYETAKSWYPDKVVRTPTVEEYKELIERCHWTFCEENRLMGYRVQGPSGNSIFIPAMGICGMQPEKYNEMGYYWTNHLGTDPMNAMAFTFDRNRLQITDVPRYMGCKWRCVMDDRPLDPERCIYKPYNLNGEVWNKTQVPNSVDLGLSVDWSESVFASCVVTAEFAYNAHLKDQMQWCKKGWRVPTFEEMQELLDKCQWQWTKYFGCDGYKVLGPSGNSIFIPAWSDSTTPPPLTQDYYCDFWTSSGNKDNALVLRVGNTSRQFVEIPNNGWACARCVHAKS